MAAFNAIRVTNDTAKVNGTVANAQRILADARKFKSCKSQAELLETLANRLRTIEFMLDQVCHVIYINEYASEAAEAYAKEEPDSADASDALCNTPPNEQERQAAAADSALQAISFGV